MTTYKLATILSIIRSFIDNKSLNKSIECKNSEFDIALSLSRVLLSKPLKYLLMMKKKRVSQKYYGLKYDLLCQMPESFTTRRIYDIAKGLGIKERTAVGYLNSFVGDGLIFRVKKGEYSRLF